MRSLLAYLKRDRYFRLIFVGSAVGSLLGSAALTDAWDACHAEKWLPRSWTLAEAAEFRLFYIDSAGAVFGMIMGAFLPTFSVVPC